MSPDHNGVPVGLLAAPFQISSAASLWSSDLWSAFGIAKGRSISDTLTVMLHIYIFVLAALSAPASAIVMLPKLDWWPVRSEVPNTVKYGAVADQLYPASVDATSSLHFSAGYPLSRNSYPEILDSLLWMGGVTSQFSHVAANITVQRVIPRAITVQNSGFYEEGGDKSFNHGTASATTPLDQVSVLMSSLMSDLTRKRMNGTFDGAQTMRFLAQATDSTGTRQWKQPYVTAQCAARVVSDVTQLRNTSDNTDLAAFSLWDPARQGRLGTAVLDTNALPQSWNETGLAILPPTAVSLTPAVPVSAVVALSGKFVHHDDTPALCLISAEWIDSDLSILTSTRDGIPESAGSLRPLSLERNDTAVHPISLSSDWLMSMGSEWMDEQPGISESFWANLTATCDDPKKPLSSLALNSQCIALGLAAGIAEGLAQLPVGLGVYQQFVLRSDLGLMGFRQCTFAEDDTARKSNNCTMEGFDVLNRNAARVSLAAANGTQASFEITQSVYSYGFRGVTITFAFVILLLYTITVLVHILVVAFGSGWSSSAWSTLAELLVLALHSPSAPLLANTGGGVNSASTWKLQASLEELGDGNRVGLVVGGPELDSHSIKRVCNMPRADWKYS